MAVNLPHRHAELVSASISQSAPISPVEKWTLKQVQGDENSGVRNGIEAQSNGQIMPVGILALDQIDLPLPMPAFELLFAQDRALHVPEHLVSDEPVNAVAARKSFDRSGTVLPQSRDEIAGNADVESSMWLAGQDINARITLEWHNRRGAELWTLKQVQGDGMTKF